MQMRLEKEGEGLGFLSRRGDHAEACDRLLALADKFDSDAFFDVDSPNYSVQRSHGGVAAGGGRSTAGTGGTAGSSGDPKAFRDEVKATMAVAFHNLAVEQVHLGRTGAAGYSIAAAELVCPKPEISLTQASFEILL